MMAYMIPPDATRCRENGIAHFAHVPVIWSAGWKLCEEAVTYLMARASGQWEAGRGAKSEYSRSRKPSANSMKAYGRDLENFLTYCERFNVDWRTVRYFELLETYQFDMETGQFSSEGTALSASTINRRMNTVGDFLSFASHFGLRDPFAVDLEGIPGHLRLRLSARTGQKSNTGSRRVGRVRKDPDDLRLPTRTEIKTWLDGIKSAHPGVFGITGYLMCRTILELGLRAEELLLLQIDQIPNPDDVKPDAFTVSMEICYGTKGGRRPEDAEKKGKPRKVAIPVDYLRRLHDYKRLTRQVPLKVYREKHPGQPAPKQMFLSPETGRPYGYRRLHEIWTQAKDPQKSIPFEGWSPHLGRHAWACYEVLSRLEAELERIKQDAILTGGRDHTPSFALVDGMARNLIDQFIRPVLGHVSVETTERYLRWLHGQIGRNVHSRRWSAWLDGNHSG